MPGFPKSIGAHKVHSIDMALTFFSSSSSHLGLKIQSNVKLSKCCIVSWPIYSCSIYIWRQFAIKVPLIGKVDVESGDDSGAQLNLHHNIYLILLIWFSLYSTIELEAPKGQTGWGQKAKGLQMYTPAPQEECSNLASCTCQICIYRDKMAD
jgi:hypothetical protein